jgi:sarcosine oxidase
MTRDVDVVVLGLGGFGAGALYWLSRRLGRGVLGLEQFEIGHVRGASQDHSRIIRLSYHTPGYVELARHAFAAWAEVSRDRGEPLVLKTGGVDIGFDGCAISLDDYTASMTAAGVPFERIDAREISRRWPAFRFEDPVYGIYQPESGIAMAARGNRAHLELAQANGAHVVDGCGFGAVAVEGDEVVVWTAKGRFRCGHLVVTAGAWSNQVLKPLGTTLPLTITQEQVTYFTPRDPSLFTPDRFPIWIWFDEPSFYGFPTFGEAGPKVAQDVGGREVAADTRTFEPDPDAFARVTTFMSMHLPEALGGVIQTKTCLYTLTPDRDFVIDRVPGHPQVLVAIGAGHGFKFASIIGRILSELALDGGTPHDLTPFRITRPILREAAPARRWLI